MGVWWLLAIWGPTHIVHHLKTLLTQPNKLARKATLHWALPFLPLPLPVFPHRAPKKFSTIILQPGCFTNRSGTWNRKAKMNTELGK